MISSEEQLRAAAERLGVEADDLRPCFPSLGNVSTSGKNFASAFSSGSASYVFESERINNVLEECRLAICERAFGNSPSPSKGTPSSQVHSTPLSPELVNPTHDADVNPSASSSPSSSAAAQTPKTKCEILTGSGDNPLFSEDESGRAALRGIKVPKADISQGTVLDESGKKSNSQRGNPIHPLSKTRSQSSSTTPLDSILSFARGQQLSLVDVSALDEQNALRKMRSLSIIPGCDMYSTCCLFNYLEALLKAHINLVQNLSKDQHGLATVNVDDLHCEITDRSWRTTFSDSVQPTPAREGHTESCPPMMRNSMDLVQFTYHLVNRTYGACDSLTRGFLEGLYASDIPKLVASLTTKLVCGWTDVRRDLASHQRQSLLLEWCVRLLTDFIVYELSPVSQVRQFKNASPDSFVVFNLGKNELPPLSTVVDYCLQFVSSHQVGKECRIALCDFVKAYVIWTSCDRPGGSPQAELWTETREPREEYLNSLVAKEACWTIVVQSALQHVKKLPQISDSCFDYTFLSSLVGLPAAEGALFDDKKNRYKWILLKVMIRSLESISRDPLLRFTEAEECRNLFPDTHSSIDFIHRLITSATVQREILGADRATKGRFLSSLESLITNSAKVVRCSISVGEALGYAQKGPFAKTAATEFEGCETYAECGNSTDTKKEIEQMKSIAREKAVAFAAKLIGCLGKSVADGSTDMAQMNSIKALCHARINSSRAQRRFWNDIYKIYRGVGKKIGTQVLLSAPERNSFAMVVEFVRKRTVSDSVDRNTGTPAQENSVASGAIARKSPMRETDVSLPPVWDVSELQHSVCDAKGYTNFDNDHAMLMFMKDALTEKGQQMLARYDPHSPFTGKWTCLQRRNAYIGGARGLLEKSDKTIGQLCSCVPGYPKENGSGNENRIACSNDLCENRHMKIECVPGKCGAGSYCMNQRMQNLEYAKFKTVPFPGKGVGLVADEDIPEGALVGEYQGEVVTMHEYERRVQEYEGERHFYFMTLTNKLVIDASRKSQATRFLNHSCDPNAETQKWNADGEPRVGIFAKRAISKGEEITFDYGARSLSQYSARCLCGAKNCRGILAVRKEEPGKSKEFYGKRFDNDDDRKGSPNQGTRAFPEGRRSSVVKEKIVAAQRYLCEADALSRKAEEKTSFQSDLSNDMRRKLNLWKASFSSRSTAISEKSCQQAPLEVKPLRIPRRSVLPPQKEKDSTETSHDERTGRNNSSKKMSAPRETQPSRAAQNIRSSVGKPKRKYAPRWALVEDTCSGKLGASKSPLKRKAEGESPRRVSKLPRAGFLPTRAKLKEKPLRPKFAKRKRTREHDGNDSLDEYSTASEAEPIFDEPMISPSRLPDGNGACSDDEFVEAPPVESTGVFPTYKRGRHPDQVRRVPTKWQMSRSAFDGGLEQTRDRSRYRIGTSRRPAGTKIDANLPLNIHSGYGVRSPRTCKVLWRIRAVPQDVVAHVTNPSGPCTDGKKYKEYRHGCSPGKHRQFDSRMLDNRLEIQGMKEEISDYHHRPRPLARNHNIEYLSSRSGYRAEAEASALPDGKERIQTHGIFPAHGMDQGQRCTRIAAMDKEKAISTKLGPVNPNFRSFPRVEAHSQARNGRECMRPPLPGDNHAMLDQPQPYQEVYESTRFPGAVMHGSHVECRDHDDRKFTYHMENEAGRLLPRSLEDRHRVVLDQRNRSAERSRKKRR